MKLCVLDTETTGFSVNDRVIEIAAALYETSSKTVLWQMASLVPGETENPVQHINGISPQALAQVDQFYDPFEEVGHYAGLATCIVAHNASFDRRMLGDRLPSSLVWVCSQNELCFPREGKSRRLTHLAVDHGVLTIGSHRAMGDVNMLVALLRHTPDIEAQVEAILRRRGQL